MPSYDYHRGYQIELLSEPGARPRWLARDASGFNLGTIEPTAGFRAFIASRVGLSGCTVTAIRGDQQAAASWLARQRISGTHHSIRYYPAHSGSGGVAAHYRGTDPAGPGA